MGAYARTLTNTHDHTHDHTYAPDTHIYTHPPHFANTLARTPVPQILAGPGESPMVRAYFGAKKTNARPTTHRGARTSGRSGPFLRSTAFSPPLLVLLLPRFAQSPLRSAASLAHARVRFCEAGSRLAACDGPLRDMGPFCSARRDTRPRPAMSLLAWLRHLPVPPGVVILPVGFFLGFFPRHFPAFYSNSVVYITVQYKLPLSNTPRSHLLASPRPEIQWPLPCPPPNVSNAPLSSTGGCGRGRLVREPSTGSRTSDARSWCAASSRGCRAAPRPSRPVLLPSPSSAFALCRTVSEFRPPGALTWQSRSLRP